MKKRISKVGARLTGKQTQPEKPKRGRPAKTEKKTYESVTPENELFDVGDVENKELENYFDEV